MPSLCRSRNDSLVPVVVLLALLSSSQGPNIISAVLFHPETRTSQQTTILGNRMYPIAYQAKVVRASKHP